MAFIQYSFDVRGMGDSSSGTTTYVAELVSCSDTTKPLILNGYAFKTTISDAEKTAEDILVTFDGVPVNTLLPANHKLKVTGNKNGNALVRYGDCESNQVVVCAENPTNQCVISNVSVGQPICTGNPILQPFSFMTTQLGTHKLELFRILPDGQAPTIVKSDTINVTSISILQTGTLSLENLNSDNYKLYVTALDEEGGNDCVSASTITLLSCGTVQDCIKPTFNLSSINPSCDTTTPQGDGKLVITNVVGGSKVRYCNGQTWGCSEDYNVGVDITSTDSFLVSQNIGISPGADFDYYTVRVYKNAACWTDKVIKISKPECNLDACTFGEKIYSGTAVDKPYAFKNNTSQVQTYYIKLEANSPVRFTVKRDTVLVYDSGCAGINLNGCSTCVQSGIFCGSILVSPGQVISMHLDSTCFPDVTSNYKIAISCSPITSCSSVVKIGETNTCGIVLPTNTAKFQCNSETNNVLVRLEGYYGGISGEYEFGYDMTRLATSPSQITWVPYNTVVVPKSTAFKVWLRDKKNTDCYTQIDVNSPSCAPTSVYPIIDQSSVTEVFSQSGNKITAQVANIDVNKEYQVRYGTLGTPPDNESIGSLNKSSGLLTVPVPPVSIENNLLQIKVVDRVSGVVSNIVKTNALNEETIYFDVIENKCNASFNPQNATFIHLKVRQTGSATRYAVKIYDAVTSAVISETVYNVTSDIYILHTESNRKVTIQVVDADNPLKGSQINSLVLTQLDCTASTGGNCDCVEKIAYGVNARNSGTTPDSIRFVYKGTTCKRYKLYLESESVRGTYELYDDRTASDTTIRTLTGAYSEYNYMPIEAMASRVWRDKNYKVKFDYYNGGTIVKTVEFIVDLNSATALNTPIVQFVCGSTPSNNCNLTEKEQIGYKGSVSVAKLQSRLVNSQWVVSEQYQDSDTLSKDRWIPRGSNYLGNSQITVTRANTTSACFAPNVTGFGGLGSPKFLAPTSLGGDGFVPNGYKVGVTDDQTTYFELLTPQEVVSYPCNQTPCTQYSGIIPNIPNDGSVNPYNKNTLVRRNTNITSPNAGYITPFKSREEVVRLVALAAADLTNSNPVDGDGYKVLFSLGRNVLNGQYQQQFTVGSYLLQDTTPPYDNSLAQCGFFVEVIYENGIDYTIAQRYRILTVDPCGKIINIETIIVGTDQPVSNDLATLAGTMRTMQGVLDTVNTSQSWAPEFCNFVPTYLGNNKVSLVNTAPTREPSSFGISDRIARYVLDYGVGRITINGDAGFVGKQFEIFFPIQIWLFWDYPNQPAGTHDANYMRGYSKLVFK